MGRQEFKTTSSGRYECKSCLKTFSRIGGLKQHLTCHAQEKVIGKRICEQSEIALIQPTPEDIQQHQSSEEQQNIHKYRSNICLIVPKDDQQLSSGRYECKICFVTFSRVSGLTQHMLNHVQTKPCAKLAGCDYIATSPLFDAEQTNTSKILHREAKVNMPRGKSQLSSGRHECESCLQTFSRTGGLKQHIMLSHANVEPKQADGLTEKHPIELSTAGHFQSVVELMSNANVASHDIFVFNLPNSSGRFECQYCFKTYSRKGGLTQHMLSHTGIKPFSCEICGRKFERKYSLDIHTRWHINEKPNRCEICDRGFTTKGQLAVHIRSHIKEKPFACGTCGKKFTQNDHLKAHQLSHEKMNKRFKCPICPATFTRKYTVTLHINGCHTNHQSFICQLCGQSFKRKQYLSGHMKTHLLEKPYSCKYCPKTFAQKGSLASHMRRHTKEKPFECMVCGKAFVDRNDLMKHSRIHNDVRPYSCNICHKTFAQIGNMKRHMLRHSGVKPFSCTACGKSFRQKVHLMKHTRTIHSVPDGGNKTGSGNISLTTAVQQVQRLDTPAMEVMKTAESGEQLEVEMDDTLRQDPITEAPELDEDWKIKEEYFNLCYPQDAPDVQSTSILLQPFVKPENAFPNQESDITKAD